MDYSLSGYFLCQKTISIPAWYRYGFSIFSLYDFRLEIQRCSISRSIRVHGAPDQHNLCDVEVRSRDARKSALKRQRLKVQFLDRLKRARNEEDIRRARLRYMICAGRTGAKIAKGRKQSKKKSLKKATTSKTKQSPKRLGRPSYIREKAPQQKKCRHCGKLLASKSGCKNHEKICNISIP